MDFAVGHIFPGQRKYGFDGWLQQLVETLIRNAIEYGGDSVTVPIGELETGFYLEDDGPGIPVDQRDAVFEAGYSISSSPPLSTLSVVSPGNEGLLSPWLLPPPPHVLA